MKRLLQLLAKASRKVGKRLLELITNDDGKLSRTQINMWVSHLTALALIILEAVKGQILTTPLIIVLCIYILSSHADRMDTRRFQVKLGKEGAHISLHGACEHIEQGTSNV